MPTKTARPKPEEIPMPPDFPDEELIVVGDVIEGDTHDADFVAAEMALNDRAVAIAPASNSVIVGLGALASMSDEEYEAKKAVMSRGLARVVDIQQSLMVDKQDYGRVPGISKPFLQLPGAEKLANFYGYAVRQEVDRLTGDGVTAPPLAYHARSYVHLGSFDGPVIGMGYGEANSWEEKYRWRFERPICTKCGHELMKAKPGGNMGSGWFCPGFKGGCWKKYTLEEVPAPGKVENTEPYGLAETLIQIAAKRSFVAAIRRATGTSGLFSQDDDSPSVQQQAADSDAGEGQAVQAEAPVGITVGVGAKSSEATRAQHDRFKVVAKEKGLNGVKVADLLLRLFDLDIEPTGAAASAAVRGLDGDQMGRLIQTIETGEVEPSEG